MGPQRGHRMGLHSLHFVMGKQVSAKVGDAEGRSWGGTEPRLPFSGGRRQPPPWASGAPGAEAACGSPRTILSGAGSQRAHRRSICQAAASAWAPLAQLWKEGDSIYPEDMQERTALLRTTDERRRAGSKAPELCNYSFKQNTF